MKNKLLIITFLFSTVLFAQAPLADELVKIHSVTTSEMNAIASPEEGSLIYNTDDSSIYEFDGTNWQKLVIEKEIIKPLTSNYTLTLEDNKCALTFDSASDVVLTVPSGLPVGYNVSIYQTGTGNVTITGSGATIKNRLLRFKTAGLDAAVGLLCTSSDVFHVSGDLKR